MLQFASGARRGVDAILRLVVDWTCALSPLARLAPPALFAPPALSPASPLGRTEELVLGSESVSEALNMIDQREITREIDWDHSQT